MGYINVGWKDIYFKAQATDLMFFRVVKARKEHVCSVCKKKLPSKSYVFSSAWISLCLECGHKFSYEALKGYEEIINYIKKNQEIFKKNKLKWEAENTLNAL